MKKTLLLLAALMMMGTAQETMAQQRKTASAKKTTTTARKGTAAKKTAAKTATPSIAWEGPGVVDGQVAFLGIPLTETKAGMKSKLTAKGIQDRRESDDDFIRLRGVIDGTRVRINIQQTASGNLMVSVYDEKTCALAKAKIRFTALVEKMKTIYGQKGKYLRNDNDWKEYEIEVGGTKEKVVVAMFNEDEMDGSSNFYQISVIIGDGI